MMTKHTSGRTKYGMPYRTNISAGTCAEDFAACVKSGDADSTACTSFVDNAKCCAAQGKK
jgi:hypothetical protein